MKKGELFSSVYWQQLTPTLWTVHISSFVLMFKKQTIALLLARSQSQSLAVVYLHNMAKDVIRKETQGDLYAKASTHITPWIQCWLHMLRDSWTRCPQGEPSCHHHHHTLTCPLLPGPACPKEGKEEGGGCCSYCCLYIWRVLVKREKQEGRGAGPRDSGFRNGPPPINDKFHRSMGQSIASCWGDRAGRNLESGNKSP